MRALARTRRPMLLALLALPLLTGCATSSMWGWVLEDDGGPATTTTVYRTNTQTAEQSTRTYTTSGNSGAAFGVLLATPVTLAWDLVTLPLQIYRGDPPYERES